MMNKNEAALTPPMGWNSFDYYDTNVNESQIRANAEYMAENLRPFGWEYIVADIQWYAYDTGTQREEYEYIPFSHLEMDEYGRLLPCPVKFPSSVNGNGFQSLAEYIHSLGLKFGIHIMRGIPRTAAEKKCRILGSTATADQIADPYSICGWNPDMYGVKDNEDGQKYYDSLAALYAGWGVDFIKCDDICNTYAIPGHPDAGIPELKMLYRAILKTGRKMVLSLSPGPALLEQGWSYSRYSNMWRVSGDFWDNWAQLREMFDHCEKWHSYVKPGCYPDCDMLPVGWVGKEFGDERTTRFSVDEQKTMMTLWCMMKSPLMLGAELTKLDTETLALLCNQKVLDLLKFEYQNRQYSKDEEGAVWIGENKAEQKLYIAMFNFGPRRERKTELKEIAEILDDDTILSRTYMENIWDGRIREITEDTITDEIAEHGVSAWILYGNNQ